MKGKVVLKAGELDGYLTAGDKVHLESLEAIYRQATESFGRMNAAEGRPANLEKETARLIELYDLMGNAMKGITAAEPAIKVYSFETHRSQHPEVSRLIAKLRDRNTGHAEFVYYTQRAYELLFNLMTGQSETVRKNYLIVKTPVTRPVQNYAVHKIPDVEDRIKNSVMCVMLRGALLPSLIMSKEIQEYSSTGYLTPFALFRIKRDDDRKQSDMEYVLDLDRSFFRMEDLDGRDLIFADPMNATGGSLVTIIRFLKEQGIKPASVGVVNIIGALKGVLQIVRSIENVTCYTLWMDPVLNDAAYILPGLGDAGDRINGSDTLENPRNIIQLIGDYGENIVSLYRSQLRKIEETVLG
jgi:uracil phosphoribosyltransferase